MKLNRCRLLFLVVAGLFGLSGASCPQFLQQQAYCPPRVLPARPEMATLEQLLSVVNGNNRQIQAFSTNTATVTGTGCPSLRATLAFQRSQRLRLRANLGITSTAELDLGGNDELFWFWVRRENPPSLYYCRYDQLAASPLRRSLPLQPDWLIDAMGIAVLDPALPYQGPEPLPNDRLKLSVICNTPDGPVTKVMVLDGGQGWILEQQMYDARGQMLVSSTCSHHRRDPLSGLVMPTVVQVNCPAAQFAMQINLGNVEINRLTGNPVELWSMPQYPHVRLVDLANPPSEMLQPIAAPQGRTSRRPRPRAALE